MHYEDVDTFFYLKSSTFFYQCMEGPNKHLGSLLRDDVGQSHNLLISATDFKLLNIEVYPTNRVCSHRIVKSLIKTQKEHELILVIWE